MVNPANRVLAALEDRGLLLVQDQALPSVVGILTGESPRTSWWSHPKGRVIFSVLRMLADHDDVLFTKLVAGKATLVHRRLWPDLMAVGMSGEPWQSRGLPAAARNLRRRLEASEGSVRATGPAVKDVERRLLAVTREVHTESGRHETVVETWEAWGARVRCRASRSAARALERLELAAASLGAPPDALPWRGSRTARSSPRKR